MAIKSRIFNVMQYEKHPDTGEPLLNEEQIKDALAHRTVTRWAYAYHDKDVYSALDEEHNPDHRKGETKPPHWHIVMEFKNNAVEIGVVARWLGIAENFVNVAKGQGAFLDCVQYLTHEDAKQRELGKYLYPDEEIKANFNFREQLMKRAERKAKYGRDLDDKSAVRNEVIYRGMSLREVREKYPLIYQDDFTYLKKCRLNYITEIAEVPKVRMNFYIEGEGGLGKGLISKAIARALVDPNREIKYDDDIFFEIGQNDVSFEGYDGQPVIIWNDCRSFELMQKLGGREGVFNVFESTPTNTRQNIKYGSVRLNNSINIVNSVQSYEDFLDGLAGEYIDKRGEKHKAEDKGQSYRRFPFFLVLHENDYDLGMNKGVFDGTREYDQYMIIRGLRGNMYKIAQRCGGNIELQDVAARKMLAPVTEKYLEMKDRMRPAQVETDEEILASIDPGEGQVVVMDLNTHKEIAVTSTQPQLADFIECDRVEDVPFDEPF